MINCGRRLAVAFSLEGQEILPALSCTIDSSFSDSFLSPASAARTSAVTSTLIGALALEMNSATVAPAAGLLFQVIAPSVHVSATNANWLKIAPLPEANV